MYEQDDEGLRVLLVHPGGPYEKKKDIGRWSIPKGEVDEGEDLQSCARREFLEETGHDSGAAPLIPLGSIRQKGGKEVYAWAFAGKWNPAKFTSNTFEMEWPPHSGQMRSYPEVDRAEMLPTIAAMHRIKETQRPLIERLAEHLAAQAGG